MNIVADERTVASASEAARSRPESIGYAWYVVFILMLCYTLSFIDRQILSLLVGPIKQDLLVSDTQIGLLGGLAFSLFYTLMGLPCGWLADRYNRSTALSIYSMGVFIGSGLALIVGGIVVQSVVHMPEFDVPLLGAMASCSARMAGVHKKPESRWDS